MTVNAVPNFRSDGLRSNQAFDFIEMPRHEIAQIDANAQVKTSTWGVVDTTLFAFLQALKNRRKVTL
jgi:hypothetical protein